MQYVLTRVKLIFAVEQTNANFYPSYKIFNLAKQRDTRINNLIDRYIHFRFDI